MHGVCAVDNKAYCYDYLVGYSDVLGTHMLHLVRSLNVMTFFIHDLSFHLMGTDCTPTPTNVSRPLFPPTTLVYYIQ